MVKVYRPDGGAEEKDPVDARECVKHCGYTYDEPFPGDTGDAVDDLTSTDKSTKGAKKNAKTADSNAAADNDVSTASVVDGAASSAADSEVNG